MFSDLASNRININRCNLLKILWGSQQFLSVPRGTTTEGLRTAIFGKTDGAVAFSSVESINMDPEDTCRAQGKPHGPLKVAGTSPPQSSQA